MNYRRAICKSLDSPCLHVLLDSPWFGASHAKSSNENGKSAIGIVEGQELSMKKIALFIFLLVTMVSGCSVLANSERFYRDRPPRAINWREYTSD